MVDARAQATIESFQFHDPSIDLVAIRRSSYGEFSYALQVVIESDLGWRETRSEVLKTYRQTIIACCQKHEWLLSRIGILSDHMHILLAARMTDSPESIALSLMNNLAFSQGMKPMFRFSYYVGGFGHFDRGAIRNARFANLNE